MVRFNEAVHASSETTAEAGMLMLLGARERTEGQYRRLLADAGFEPRRVVPTGSPAGLSVLEAAVASHAH
jgi:hypothetical protein